MESPSSLWLLASLSSLSFLHAPATTEIYTLSLHDALPILCHEGVHDPRAHEPLPHGGGDAAGAPDLVDGAQDRKSTRLNSSHTVISYAVFCLKKKTKQAQFVLMSIM